MQCGTAAHDGVFGTSTQASHTGPFAGAAIRMRLAIHSSLSWEDLDAAADEVDRMYGTGELERSDSEELAALIGSLSRAIPETLEAQAAVAAEELLDGAAEACACCGETDWWHKDGERICAVCHPRPQWASVARSAA